MVEPIACGNCGMAMHPGADFCSDDCARQYHDDVRDAEDELDPDWECMTCGGEGYVLGEDMGDPLFYSAEEVLSCHNCGGSGKRKDQTFW